MADQSGEIHPRAKNGISSCLAERPGGFDCLPENRHANPLIHTPGEYEMNQKIDRRKFIRLTAAGGGAVFMSGLYGQVKAAAPDQAASAYEDFYFVQLSDAHWGFNGPPNPDAANTLKKAVASVNALPLKPDFIVFTGDLTHTT